MIAPPSDDVVGHLGGRIFDHHIHTDGRSAEDYELLALAGVDNILVPCSMSNERRSSGPSFEARFERLLEVETRRASFFGVRAWVALSVHAADMTDLDSALVALHRLAPRLADRRVRALGEISLRTFGDDELVLFELQLQLADSLGLPVMIELPPDLDSYHRMHAVIAALLNQRVIESGRVALMDVTPESLPFAKQLDCGAYGMAVCPSGDRLFQIRQKSTAADVLGCLDEIGTERLMLNSGLHFGSADPLALPKTALRLRLAGLDDGLVTSLTAGNAARFFDVPLPSAGASSVLGLLDSEVNHAIV